jgi:hypothetical protein
MKKSRIRHQKYKSMQITLESYQQAFEGNQEAIAVMNSFSEYNSQLSALLSKLTRPVSTVYQPKMNKQIEFTRKLRSMIGVGTTVASRTGDASLLYTLRLYRTQLKNASAFLLREMAVHLSEEMTPHTELLTGLGITPALFEAFNQMIQDFSATVDNTRVQLNVRKSDRKAIFSLLKTCNNIVRDQLDPLVLTVEDEQPDLYREWFTLRARKKGKSQVNELETANSDISGTVTDSTTNQPLAFAIVTLVEQGTVTESDEDGYYTFDELSEGDYTLSCHASGYDVPEVVKVAAGNDDSVVVDFNLKRVNPILN